MTTDSQEICLEGNAISPGIAIGVAVILDDSQPIKVFEIALLEDQIETEISRYREALEETRVDLRLLKEQLEQEGVKDGANVLDAHLQITEDPLLNIEIEREIRKTKRNAEFVFQNAMNQFGAKLQALSDPFFQQRFEDVQDIAKRVLRYLHKNQPISFRDFPEQSIIIADSISPSIAAEAKRGHIIAFVTKRGGEMSHTAIVAKARGIPYISNVDIGAIYKQCKNDLIIVDGLSGKIYLKPTPNTHLQYRNLHAHIQSQFEQLKSTCALPAMTTDNHRIRLSANVEITDDFDLLNQYGAEGVGLFRSEYMVLQKGIFPTEEEQYKVYSNLISHMKNQPVVIRVFDIGMDKTITRYKGADINSTLGSRAIRFLLHEKEIFYHQVRAIIRAATHGTDVRILFPMVSSLGELREAKDVVRKACEDLSLEGIVVPYKIKIGCMIELPSAAMIADLLAKECDFLSIGTNDLIQYALAIDRTQQSSNTLLNSTHPGVLRLVQMIIREASRVNVPVSVCGEIASDPRFVPLLLGLGIKEMSVAVPFLPVIKHIIRSMSQKDAEQLVSYVLTLDTAQAIQNALNEHYQRNIREESYTFQ